MHAQRFVQAQRVRRAALVFRRRDDPHFACQLRGDVFEHVKAGASMPSSLVSRTRSNSGRVSCIGTILAELGNERGMQRRASLKASIPA